MIVSKFPMNPKFFAWILVGCCGLFGAGYMAATHVDQTLPPQENAPSVIKAPSAPDSSSPSSLPDTTAVPEQSFSSNGQQFVQQALDSTNPQQQDENLRRSLTDWTVNNPLNAATFVRGMPTGILRDKALRILAQTWGSQNPNQALNWCGALSEKSEHDIFLTNVCLGLAQRDPAAAVAMACQNHDTEAGLMENLTQQWAEKETPAALSWATQQPPGQSRDQLLQRIAFVESKTDPAQAASLVVQQMQSGPAQTEAVMTVVHQWGERDWNSAAAWVGQFPEGPLRDRAITELNGITRD